MLLIIFFEDNEIKKRTKFALLKNIIKMFFFCEYVKTNFFNKKVNVTRYVF